MRKIKVFLDYQCYPIWVYNEKNELMYNDLPDELKNEAEIQELLKYIQITYDNLFIDTEVEFKYKGFDDEVRKIEFLRKTSKVMQLIESRLGDIYKIENKIDI